MQAFESKDERWGKSEQTETLRVCHMSFVWFYLFPKTFGGYYSGQFFFI